MVKIVIQETEHEMLTERCESRVRDEAREIMDIPDEELKHKGLSERREARAKSEHLRMVKALEREGEHLAVARRWKYELGAEESQMHELLETEETVAEKSLSYDMEFQHELECCRSYDRPKWHGVLLMNRICRILKASFNILRMRLRIMKMPPRCARQCRPLGKRRRARLWWPPAQQCLFHGAL